MSKTSTLKKTTFHHFDFLTILNPFDSGEYPETVPLCLTVSLCLSVVLQDAVVLPLLHLVEKVIRYWAPQVVHGVIIESCAHHYAG